ncbi:hypothetical protein EVAR_44818_1 [Eumeta japonica]|uniref:Uncharacterized protein n=1 Tax=Eumeta variegata TaxID=151549 RepID=A0A4C1X9N5_EUMVA|nr:hypothetical protein EVAR_44818_1 [Eumeta japonica]
MNYQPDRQPTIKKSAHTKDNKVTNIKSVFPPARPADTARSCSHSQEVKRGFTNPINDLNEERPSRAATEDNISIVRFMIETDKRRPLAVTSPLPPQIIASHVSADPSNDCPMFAGGRTFFLNTSWLRVH